MGENWQDQIGKKIGGSGGGGGGRGVFQQTIKTLASDRLTT